MEKEEKDALEMEKEKNEERKEKKARDEAEGVLDNQKKHKEVKMAEANLIVTFDPTHTQSAKSEIESLLKELKEAAKILKCEEGLAEISVKNARNVVASLLKLKKDKFSYTFHWIPVDKWCKATIADMQKVIKDAAKTIAQTEKWKMEVGRHKTDVEGKGLVLKLTEVIDKPKVDLENPDKIVQVQIIGNKAGIALLKKNEFLNTLLKK